MIARVPEEVIGDPVKERKDGTDAETDVTVPDVIVVQVIGVAAPPWDVRTWPGKPTAIGRL